MLAKRAHEEKEDRLRQVAAHAEDRLRGKELEQVRLFIQRFYARVWPEDLLRISVENLFGAALAIWRLAHQRRPGECRIRAYNPRVEEHGWKSPHTIIEVINDDMPFIVDSVVGCLNRQQHNVHLLIHPVLSVSRSESGELNDFAAERAAGTIAESMLHIEIDEHTDPDVLSGIERSLAEVMADVRAAVEDWHKLLNHLDEAIESLAGPIPAEADEVAETRAFLEWMRDNHFTFLGSRDLSLEYGKDGTQLLVDEDSCQGILRDPGRRVLHGGAANRLTPMAQAFFDGPELLEITKTSVRGLVHRPVHMDYVGVKRFDGDGKVIGERSFVGLFTSSAYSRTPRDIPLLRRKVGQVLSMAELAPFSHDGKALTHILDTYPRDELFQIDIETLHNIALGILALQERPQIRLFAHRDKFERFFSFLVFVPRERINTELRSSFGAILVEACNGRLSNYYYQVGDAPLARMHFIIGTNAGQTPDALDYVALERRLVDAARNWTEDLHAALVERWGEERGNELHHRYGAAFPTAYTESFNVDRALSDIEHIESLADGHDLALNFYRVIEDAEHEVRFKIYHPESSVPLTACMATLEHMGFEVIGEVPFEVRPQGGPEVWIQDFFMRAEGDRPLDLSALKQKLEEAFLRTWNGELEDDGFNGLVVSAGLEWREVALIRAFCKYLRQTGIAFSDSLMIATLDANPKVATLLVALFHTRFDPGHDGDSAVDAERITAAIEAELEQVASLDEDRILRRYLNLVQATVRTNYYQPAADGGHKPYISFKLDSARVAELVRPRPFREIFVYSTQVEGIHLRGGKVARGGIRWSDRREDFRTEVLGLMKAQMVKNAVIVPVGSKGGFYPKRLPASADREAVQAEVVSSYQTFIRGLLDLTDNHVGAEVVPPPQVVRYDDDDPYLVVAADKGTATFSDIANQLAREYGFWLDDAFASGGHAGYDHKAMAITARGAWESVKRHFRELDRDIQSEDFTVVGVGDMSGDVFGNGMLLSKHIRLLGAFDHRHVFVDPAPDTAAGWNERKRLFELPRSSWADYDAALISRGGGVFARSAKSVSLSPEMKALTGLATDRVTPNELINALLKAKVDLLWFGGIGTYVKASEESHADVGDRTNDAVRVDARELRCKVLGEGGNLGCTQLGRVEFAQHGGHLNTDAIDNSAGVDCSDHEVNIKILLGAVVGDGEMTEKQRDRLLAEMTGEVGELVLRNNYLQTQVLTMLESQAPALLDQQARFMQALERAGRLDREIEYLPDDETIDERQAKGQGLTRPELSVMVAYAKMWLYQQFLDSDLIESDYLLIDVVKYFPRPLRKRYRKWIRAHRLRCEIIATVTANSIVNRTGVTFVHDVIEETGEPASAIARAYAVTRDAFDLRSLWNAIEALDNRVPASLQTEMLAGVADLLRHGTLWFLRNRPQPLRIARALKQMRPGIDALREALPEVLGADEGTALAGDVMHLRERGIDEALANRLGRLPPLFSALDIVEAANATARPVVEVGRVYFRLGRELGFDWLRQAAEALSPGDYWQQTAVSSIIDDLYGQQRSIAAKVLQRADGADADAAVDSWCEQNGQAVQRSRELVEDLRQSGGLDIARLAVANRLVRRLIAA
jgi:glutamate dehydrogenase